jgi:hypothetical protein
MRAAVVYESVFGNTHHVAEAIGEGLAESMEVEVLSPEEATADRVDGLDLLVVGGPTHVHGMARSSTKEQGADKAKDAGTPDLDEHAYGETLRQWFDEIGRHEGPAAAFDTRLSASTLITGQASHGIRKRLRHHGWTVEAEAESFLVDKDNVLLDGELERARAWGAELAQSLGDPA